MPRDNAVVRPPCTVQEALGSHEGPKKSPAKGLDVTLPLGHFDASLTFCRSCLCFLLTYSVICFFLQLDSSFLSDSFYCPPLLCLLLIFFSRLTQSFLDSTDITRAWISHHHSPNNTLSHRETLHTKQI